MLILLLTLIAQPQTIDDDQIACAVAAATGATVGGAAAVAWLASSSDVNHAQGAILVVTLGMSAGGAVGGAIAAVIVGRARDAPLVALFAAAGVPIGMYATYVASGPLIAMLATIGLGAALAREEMVAAFALGGGAAWLVLIAVSAAGGAAGGAIGGLDASDQLRSAESADGVSALE